MEQKTWRELRLTLPIDLADRLKIVAARAHVPVSTLLVRLITQYVEAAEKAEKEKDRQGDKH
jgi:hypothetical protein